MTSSHQSSPGKVHGSSSSRFDEHQVVVVMVPFPAQGHLTPLLHFSRLILSHNIPVHYVGTATHNRQATLRVQGWDPNSISNIHFHDFEAPPFASPPPNPNAETKFPSHLIPSFEATSHLRAPLAALLQSLSYVARRVIVIHDAILASVVQDTKNIANVERYTFHSCSAFMVFLHSWDKMGKPQLEGSHIPQVPSLEGCFPIQFMDFITEQSEFMEFTAGHIYNTTRAIESPYMEFMENIIGSKKHWALGPFNPLTIESKNSKGRHFIMEWLDRQEVRSVIYVSFGSTTTFTEEQIEQMANGLEQSKHKFIWVLRDADKGDIFDGDKVKEHGLPNGFEKRVEGMGLVVRDWAPQLEILSHPSTGGFMSHCGWNSCLESMSMGVPIAAWPMHSDQPRNSVLIAEVVKVGLLLKDWAQRDELVTTSVIENAVRRLMETKEGDEMRERAMNLKKSIHKSMDEGGVSRTEMESFIAHITR
ncbi:zeatin O-glucosyltransferase-like [Lotus japonicus]|uniref:zeatin O-glucosyltransferase-like n=1 Tax=Lotus japonicus TaxID=34305 RepID=UPI00258EF8A1|nr:zeatin O-glucosyltransferase-like [Lotus japonicus]